MFLKREKNKDEVSAIKAKSQTLNRWLQRFSESVRLRARFFLPPCLAFQDARWDSVLPVTQSGWKRFWSWAARSIKSCRIPQYFVTSRGLSLFLPLLTSHFEHCCSKRKNPFQLSCIGGESKLSEGLGGNVVFIFLSAALPEKNALFFVIVLLQVNSKFQRPKKQSLLASSRFILIWSKKFSDTHCSVFFVTLAFFPPSTIHLLIRHWPAFFSNRIQDFLTKLSLFVAVLQTQRRVTFHLPDGSQESCSDSGLGDPEPSSTASTSQPLPLSFPQEEYYEQTSPNSRTEGDGNSDPESSEFQFQFFSFFDSRQM